MQRHSPWHFLPALLLTMLLWPVSSLGEIAPYDPDTVLSVLTLTGEQRALAEFLYSPILRGEHRIDLPAGTRYDDVAPAMRSLMQDRPELFHLGRSYSVGYEQHTPDVARYVTPEYRMDVAQAQLLRQELYAIARDLAAMYPGEEALHDALLARVTYAEAGDLSHTAVGALLEGQAVCEGYAQALSLLYRMAGVPCGVVTGTAADSTGAVQAHSWNIADLNGLTLIDATWNDQDHLSLNTRWYYGLSAAQMAADHAPDAGQSVPPCGDEANWHRARGLIAYSREDVFAAIRRLILTGEPLNLRIPSAGLYTALTGDLYGFLGDYNDAVPPEEGFYGGYAFITNDRQGCLLLWRTE